MRTFRLIGMALLAVTMCANFASCSSDDDEPIVSPVEPAEDEYVEIPLKLSVDASIDITDEPMTRADYQNPVYAIDVQEINPNTSQFADYAFGFFRSLDNITVKLRKDREYRISAALYYDFFSKLEFRDHLEGTSTSTCYKTYTDGFIYCPQNGYFFGIDHWYLPDEVDYHTFRFIEGDGYYAVMEKFSPTSGDVCSLELERVASAIEISVEGLSEGKVQCRLYCRHTATELEYQLTPDKSTLSQMFVYYDLLSEEEAKICIYFDYIPTVGESIRLVDDNVSLFARNRRKRIHIKLENTGKSGDSNTRFSFTTEKVEFIQEEQIVHNCIID